MNIKINTICFILLLFLLLGVASATDCDNETLQQTIEQANDDTLQVSLDNQDKLEANMKNATIIQASKTTTKKVVNTLKANSASGKIKTTIKTSDLKMHYKDGSKFTITLKDSSKKAIKKAKVKMTIDGKTYTKTTDSKGKASLTISLKSGKYNIVTTFDGTKTYEKKSVKNTVTIKSTIKCSDMVKYYKNKAAYYSKFYDKKGKLLKETSIKFKLNNKAYTVKTNKKGVGKLTIDLKPGKYSISSINSKTSETITKTITIKTLLETKDLTMNESDGSKFTVKVLNSNGKVSPNKKVTLNVNGKTYTPKSNSNGIATQIIDLPVGKYTITTEYEGLKNTNQITVNKNANKVVKKAVIKSEYVHSTTIPSYVNVTIPYAFHNSAYTLKTGTNGTVKMPKIEVFTVEIGSKTVKFATGKTNVGDIVTMEYKSHFVPLNGIGIVVSVDKANFRDPGIIITRTPTSTEIEYKDSTNDNIELFGFYADKSTENSETFTYMKNDKVIGKVTVQTQYYDETGVKYSLGKLYQRVNLDFPYYEITNHVNNPVVFTNTGKPVTYSYYTNYIAGYQTREDIITRFSVNGHEELEKTEQISYGHADKYRRALGFEVLQTYSIINEKVTQNILENWTNQNPSYLNKFGAMNIYGMHLASIETAWLADEIANEYSKELNVDWNRDNTLTILGGINLDDTYLHILNADMGMGVTGTNENIMLFKLINSMNLPNIEDYVLEPIAKRYWDNSSNSLDNILNSIAMNNFSFTQLGEMLYLFGENRSAIALNTTSGVSNVLLSQENNVYKGSSVHTTQDCCSVGIIPKDIIKSIRELFKIISPSTNLLTDHFNKTYGLTRLAYLALKPLLGATLNGASQAMFGLVTTMTVIQTAGSTYRDEMVDEKNWHTTMDFATFTRPGYLQGKKVYNIPNKNGGNDYIEVKINDDLTLDRNNAIYISNGQTKKLTTQETYQYFCEDYWTPFSMPTKYWDKSWRCA